MKQEGASVSHYTPPTVVTPLIYSSVANTQELQIVYFVALGKIPFWEFILENHLSICVKECVQIPPKLLSETKQIPLMEYVHGLIG